MELTPFLNLMGILLVVYLVITFSTKLIRTILGGIIVIGIVSYILVPKDIKIKLDNFAQTTIGQIKSGEMTKEVMQKVQEFDPKETLDTLKTKLDKIKEETKK